VQRQHEVDQRARQLRAGADQDREARGGDLRAALEVDDAERRAEVPVACGVNENSRGVP
jgi:hypothetical protein